MTDAATHAPADEAGKKTGSAFRYDVFLCHNRLEKPIAKDIAETLQLEAGILFFLDEYSIPASVEFMSYIEAEMRRSASCAILLGPAGWGPTHKKEAELARDLRKQNPEFRIIPVLLPGAYEANWAAVFETGAPTVNWVAFSDVNDAEARSRLLAAVLGKFDVKASGPDAVTPYIIRRQAALWKASGRKDASLLFSGELLSRAQAVAAAAPQFTGDDAHTFLLQSAAAERQRYRTRLTLAVSAAAVASMLAGVAWWQRNEAIRSAKEALVRALTATAPRAITFDRHDERAALLARQAYLIDKSVGGSSQGLVAATLADVLGVPYFSSALTLPPELAATDISATGSFVMAGDQTTQVFGPLMDAYGRAKPTKATELPKAVTAAAFDDKRDLIWTAWESGELRLIDAARLDRTIVTVPSFGRGVRALSVTPDGAYALGLSAAATLSWADVKTGSTRTWRLPNRVRAVAIAPTGDRAAALDDQSGALSLYAIGASEPSDRFTDEDVNSFLFGSTAKELIVGEGHGGVWLWRPGEAEARTQIASDAGGSVDALTRSSDGARLAAASASITAGVRVWRGPAWEDPPDIIPGPRSTLALRFTADGRFLVSADTGGGLRYWRLSGAGVKATARPDAYQQLPRPGRLYSVVRNRATGEYLVGGDHGVLQAWPSVDLDRPPLVLAPQLEAGLKLAPDVQRFVGEDGRNYLLTGHVMQLAVSADGDRIAAVDPYGFVVVIDKKAGAFISRLIAPPSTSHPAFSVALSPSGKRLAVGITSELTFMHELGPAGDAAASVQLPSPGDAVVRVALFEDEDHLLVGDDTGRLTRWILSAQPSRAVVLESGPGINGAAKLADGRLAVARGDQVDIFSQALGEPAKTIIGGLSGATSVAASDDGALLAAGFGDGSIRIWRTDDFSRNPILLKGHDEYIRSLAFDARSERLISVGDDGAIKSWTIGGDALAGIACAVVWRDLDDDERREFFVGAAPERPSCPETAVQTEARHN